jgi:hypothetical protein
MWFEVEMKGHFRVGGAPGAYCLLVTLCFAGFGIVRTDAPTL